jgi:hypothetical protein
MSSALKSVLSLWVSAAISSDDVVAWADRMIMASEEPDEPLFELSLKGPESYMKIPSSEVPHPERLSFLQEFSIRASRINLSAPLEIEQLVKWVSKTCMGQDLAEREVRFSYEIYFLYVEGTDMECAKAYVRDNLPRLLSGCRIRAEPFWSTYAQQAVAADRAKPHAG